MAGTLWDSFDHLLEKAEEAFLQFDFNQALSHWQEYYRITAKKEYKEFIEEVRNHWDAAIYTDIASIDRLYDLFAQLRGQFKNKEISVLTYRLYVRLLIRIYREKFRSPAKDHASLAVGVFEYLCENYDLAIEHLKSVLKKQYDSIMARIYLGFAYMKKNDEERALSNLTQNLFLAADQLSDDELYLTQFKMLAGQLHSKTGNPKIAAWQLTFEAWYRNALVFEEDPPFFVLMQQRESNERIIQVKYYAWERYRHFVRCLYIADYARKFLKDKKGLISEQEQYMQRLDTSLFSRYRKKRKPL